MSIPPGERAAGERYPGRGVHLDDGGGRAAGVAATRNALHRRVGRHADLDTCAGCDLDEQAEEVLGERLDVVTPRCTGIEASEAFGHLVRGQREQPSSHGPSLLWKSPAPDVVDPDVMLSLLDRSRTRSGTPDSVGLTGSIERAVRAEALGYHRFWVAEHHAVPGIANGSPAVLLAAIGAHTARIRLGSGGIMLPNHQPFVVAEQLLMLEALYPGRIDAGMGRSLGFTPPVRAALRQDDMAGERFGDDLEELRSYLDATAGVTVRPATSHRVPLYVLATGKGLEIAARLGLPAVVGGPLLAGDGPVEALDRYRRDFRPSERAQHPSVIVSLDVMVADDDATARELMLPEAWAMARSRQTGEFGPLEPVSSILGHSWTSQLRSRVEQTLASAVHGSPATVRKGLERLVERTGAAEVLASTSTYDREALNASDAALRDLL